MAYYIHQQISNRVSSFFKGVLKVTWRKAISLGEAMKPTYEASTIHFIQPQLSHVSGGSIYNLEIVKRLEEEAKGKEFLHALNSSVSELIQLFKTLPSSCAFVLDGLYLTIPEFHASLDKFIPYIQRTYLMLHYLESRNLYYSTQEKETIWTREKLWLTAVRGMIVPSLQMEIISQVRV
jgi:hypothetical protein